MNRRHFLRAASWAAPTTVLTNLFTGRAIAAQLAPAPASPQLHPVGPGEDLDGRLHSLGFSELAFKVGAEETGGNLFVIEHRNLKPGGPPLHMHLNQEEWFCVLEGKVVFQIGDTQLSLGAGESILAPRRIPHSFSSAVPSSHLLIAFAPAAKMEQYFRDANGNGALAANRDFINRYDMEWIGPSPFRKG